MYDKEGSYVVKTLEEVSCLTHMLTRSTDQGG